MWGQAPPNPPPSDLPLKNGFRSCCSNRRKQSRRSLPHTRQSRREGGQRTPSLPPSPPPALRRSNLAVFARLGLQDCHASFAKPQARNDKGDGCHCEEPCDEAISQCFGVYDSKIATPRSQSLTRLAMTIVINCHCYTESVKAGRISAWRLTHGNERKSSEI